MTDERPTNMRDANTGPAARVLPILAALGLTLIAFAWLDYVNPPFSITEDGIRDQLVARDCTDLGQCHLIGPRSSLAELHHGAVWLEILIAVRLLGGDTSAARILVLALLAVSAGTFCIVMWRWIRASIALPASVLLIGALGVSRDPSQLVNGSASAFPDVLTALGLLCYGLSGQWRFLAFSAFALGVAINVHVGSLSLIPALVVIAALAGRRSWSAVIVAVAILSLTCFVTSRAALLANVIGLARDGHLLPLLAAAFVVTLVCSGLSSRFQRLSWSTRAWIIGLILILPFGAATGWLVLWRQHHFDVRYLHPILGPAAAVAAAIVCLPFELAARRVAPLRWIPTAAVAAAAAFVALRVDPALPATYRVDRWTMAEARAVAGEAQRLGWTFEDLAVRLQAIECGQLLAGVSVWGPPPELSARDDSAQLQVVKARRGALAAQQGVVPLDGDATAVVRQIRSWLRPAKLEACRQSVETEGEPLCVAAALPSRTRRLPEQFLFATRAYPGVHALEVAAPYVAAYRIPIAPGAGETRDLRIVGATVPGCAWHITRAEGVAVEGQLPARRARLRSPDGGTGLIIVEKPFGTAACPDYDVDDRYPPCVFETTPDDALAALLEME